ncbi:MAG: phosphatidylserine decarboxylase family protein [Gemmatimonadales bacterium]
MIRVALEGWPFIAGAWIAAGILLLLHWWIAALLWLPLAVWVVAFFRDPDRPGPRGEELVLAPADGAVVSILAIEEPSFLGGPATRVSIFMNVLNVHVNRYPAGGVVGYRHYHKGRFGHAGAEKASLDNEQASVGLATLRGKLLVRQIAGLIARRIVTDHAVGTVVRQGDRMGMIRFGSRVDLFLPAGAKVLAREGDRAVAGVTVLARWD